LLSETGSRNKKLGPESETKDKFHLTSLQLIGFKSMMIKIVAEQRKQKQ